MIQRIVPAVESKHPESQTAPRSSTGKSKVLGETSGTKKVLEIRNRNIYEDYLNGASLKQLTETYFLTHKSIQRVIRQERKKPHSIKR